MILVIRLTQKLSIQSSINIFTNMMGLEKAGSIHLTSREVKLD